MQHREWTNMDKSDWPDGPWMNEPDKEQWTDEATGLPCLIKRNGSGALCGYVGVTEGHPWFMQDYDYVDADVHGGLTYSDFCQDEADEGHGICHIVEPGDFACIHEWRAWLAQQDGQGVHSRDHRWGGVDQPGRQYESQNEVGSAGHVAEAGPASVEHLPGADRVAGGDLGGRLGGHGLQAAATPSPDGVRLAGEGSDGSGDPANDTAVPEDQKATSGAGDSSDSAGGSVPEARRSGNGEADGASRGNAAAERDVGARWCPDCQRIVSPGRTYWLGFDCAHAGDLLPMHERYANPARDFMEGYSTHDVYRDRAYVKEQCAQLAAQAAKAAL